MRRWLRLWIAFVCIGYVVLAVALPVSAQTATPATTPTPTASATTEPGASGCYTSSGVATGTYYDSHYGSFPNRTALIWPAGVSTYTRGDGVVSSFSAGNAFLAVPAGSWRIQNTGSITQSYLINSFFTTFTLAPGASADRQFTDVSYIHVGVSGSASASICPVLTNEQLTATAAAYQTPTPNPQIGCQFFTLKVNPNLGNELTLPYGEYTMTVSWPPISRTSEDDGFMIRLIDDGTPVVFNVAESELNQLQKSTTLNYEAPNQQNGFISAEPNVYGSTTTGSYNVAVNVQICSTTQPTATPTTEPTGEPPATPTAGCINQQVYVSSEIQYPIFLFAGSYTFTFYFVKKTYHTDSVVQFELADNSGAPIYRRNIAGGAYNTGVSFTMAIDTVDGYYNLLPLYPDMADSENNTVTICNAVATPTMTATSTPTSTPTSTSTSTPTGTITATSTPTGTLTSTPTATNTATPTSTSTPTPTFLPGTTIPTSFPDSIPTPECVVCPPTPTMNGSPLPELGIVLPTMAPLSAGMSVTVSISVTAIIGAVQTVQAGVETPAAALQTSTAQFSWQAGQERAATWADTMRPALDWLSIINPNHPAYSATGGPLWALAPVLLPVLPIIAASILISFVRFFIWVSGWLLKLLDVIFKILELIPGE